MLGSFNSGVSGLENFQKEIDVIGNNIANINTAGYRASRIDFADAFNITLRGGTSSSTGTSTSAMQIGTGVTASAIKSNFSQQGTSVSTGHNTDLLIKGDGFFLVRDPSTNTTYATRAGQFKFDNDGYLTTNEGLRVQGFNDNTLSARGDIKMDNFKDGAALASQVSGYTIGSDGKIKVTLSDSTSFDRGQILLQKFTNPQALVKEGYNLYSGVADAGPLGGASSPTAEAPNTNGLGELQSGAYEASNVDLAREFTGLITAQRAFQASSRIITTSDEMLQEVVNLKR